MKLTVKPEESSPSPGGRRVGKHIEELQVGERATRTQVVTDRDVYLYMGLVGDLNPIYVDRHYAARTPFERPVVPGILVAGHIVAAITGELPGPGTITVSQTFHFVAPVRPGDVLTTELEIVALDLRENRAIIQTVTRNQAGEVVVTGESTVMPPPPLRPVLSYAFEGYE